MENQVSALRASCLQENLQKAMAIVGRAANIRGTLPILSNVLLESNGGRIRLSTTDLTIAISTAIGAKVESAGALTVPARQLTDYVNALPPDRIDLTVNPKIATLALKCARYGANLKGVDASEFPVIRHAERPQVEIEPDILRDALAQTVIAAATDDSRPVLSGVLFAFSGATLTLAAADGFRLAVHTLPARPFDHDLKVIVPARALSEIIRLSGNLEEPIGIAFTESQNHTPGHLIDDVSWIAFRLGDTEIQSTVIDGNFPDFMAIIPKSHATTALANTADLQAAIKSANVFAKQASNIVRLNIGCPDKVEMSETNPGEVKAVPATPRIIVAATSAETGDSAAEIDAAIMGEPLEIAFNAKYLSEVLAVLKTPQVQIELTRPDAPGVIRPAGENDYQYVIMPMAIKGR